MPTKKKRVQTRLIPKKDAFLAAFRACCNVTEAARRVGCDRSLHYSWLKDDPEYAKAFADSIAEAAGTLEDSAISWAVDGIFEPTQYRGAFVFEEVPVLNLDGSPVLDSQGKPLYKRGKQFGIYRRDPGLLKMLLSAWIPKYRESDTKDDNAEPPAFVVAIEPKNEAK